MIERNRFSIRRIVIFPLIILAFVLFCRSPDLLAQDAIPETEEELYQKCKQLFSAGKFAEAEKYIEHFQSLYPESEKVVEVLFMQAFLQPSIDTATKIYNEIIENHPGSKWAAKSHFQLGQCYYLKGEYDKAMDQYGKIIVSYHEYENYWPARYWKCRSLIASGKYKEALTALHSLKESSSGEISRDMILMSLGNCYLKMKDYRSAVVVYRSIIEGKPGSQHLPSAYLLLGKSLQYLDRTEEAKSLYEKVIENYSRSIEAHQAKKYLDSFLAAQPKTPETTPARPKIKGKSSYFSIQVGAFSSKRNAEKLAGKLRKKGYSVTVTPPPSGSRLYRVKVGKFKSRDAALKAARRLGRNEELNTEVVPL